MHFTEDQMARVKRATERFDERIRNLYQPLAQVLTGKRSLRVRPHPSSSFTDGKDIWLHVPMELADDTEHTKELCGVRDPSTKEMLCTACKTIDNIDGVCFHEINHITQESFLKVDAEARRKAVVSLVAEKFPDDPSKVDSLIRKMEMLGVEDAMAIASGLDLWLPMLTNALEDIFVNERGFVSRPGIKLPIIASNRRFLTERFEAVDGTLMGWADRDLDSQAIIAVYALGAGYEEEMKSVLSGEVLPLVADPRIQDVLSRVSSAKHPVDRLHLAIEALAVLREYGWCVDSRSEIFEPKVTVVLTDDDEDDDEDKLDLDELQEEFDDVEVIDMRTPTEGDGDGDDEGNGGGDEDEGEAESKPTATTDIKGSNPDADEDADSGEGEVEDDDDTDDAKGDAESGSNLEGDRADEDSEDEGNAELGGDHKPESRPDDAPVKDADEWGSGDDSADSLSEDIDEGDDDHAKGLDGDDTDEDRKEIEAADDAGRELEIEAAQRAAEDLKRAMGHSEDRADYEGSSSRKETELLELWLDQRDFFDDPSYNVRKIKNIEADTRYLDSYVLERAPGVHEVNPVLGPLRVAFTENAKMGLHRSLKAGNRLDTAHLYRVPLEDPRVFARRELPHKRDWFVVIGCDCSGSTGGAEIETIRKGAYAMAELLSRLGIRFAVYGHSGEYEGRRGYGEDPRYNLTMFHVKNPNEPWDEAARKRCLSLEAHAANLDGHTLEFYRRVAMSERATDRLIMYFTDGAMPAENPEEELRVLQRNIRLAQHQKVRVVGVAVHNDDPKRYGLDTIRYDHIGHLPYLIQELGKRLV